VMRWTGFAAAHEQLKAWTRGRRVAEEALKASVAKLDRPSDAKARLLALRPADYVGLAARLAREI